MATASSPEVAGAALHAKQGAAAACAEPRVPVTGPNRCNVPGNADKHPSPRCGLHSTHSSSHDPFAASNRKNGGSCDCNGSSICDPAPKMGLRSSVAIMAQPSGLK